MGWKSSSKSGRSIRREYKRLLVCRELYRQQFEMHQLNVQRVEDRIVSIRQPPARPIKRTKARRDTEFSAKLNVSLLDGYSFVNWLGWDNCNEGGDLIEQIERYHRRFGCCPESVHVDKVYCTGANRAYCKGLVRLK